MIGEIFTRLLEASGVGTQGTDIFLYDLPNGVTQGVLVKLPLEGIRVDPYIPCMYEANIQVIVRANTQAAGDILSNQVIMALANETSQVIRDVANTKDIAQIHYVRLDKLPIRYPRLEGNEIEWSVNFYTRWMTL